MEMPPRRVKEHIRGAILRYRNSHRCKKSSQFNLFFWKRERVIGAKRYTQVIAKTK